jgi:hypothetical protein
MHPSLSIYVQYINKKIFPIFFNVRPRFHSMFVKSANMIQKTI